MFCTSFLGKALKHPFKGHHQQRRLGILGCLCGIVRPWSERICSLGISLHRKVYPKLFRHNEALARNVADSGCIQGIVLSLQEPDPNLKRIAALALNEIAKHSVDLAQIVLDAGAAPYLTQQINHHDAQLKKQTCQTLSNIAKHSPEMAETICGCELFPKILYKLKDPDEGVRKMAASVIREVTKQSP